MKYIKMLGLLAVAAAALMAFAGVASATTVTSPTGTTYTSTIKATAGKTTLTGSFVEVECTSSTVEGNVEKHGSGVTAGGKITALTFSGCNYEVTTKDAEGNLKAGSLEVHPISGTYNGTLTSVGAEISVHTSVGTCVFNTGAGTDIGTLTGGKNAKLDIASAKIPRTGGSFLCGSNGIWEGSYTVNTPGELFIDA